MSLLSIVQQAFGEIGLGSPGSVVGNADVNVSKGLALTNRAGLELRDATNAADYWPVLRKQFLFNLAGVGTFTGTFTFNSNVITGVVYTGGVGGAGLATIQPGWQVSSKYALNDTMVSSVNVGAQTVTMSQVSTVTQAQGSASDTSLAFGQEAYPYPADINYFIPGTGWDRNFRWQLLGPINAVEWQVVKSGISPVGPRMRYRLMAGQIYVNPAPYVIPQTSTVATDLIVMEYCSNFWTAPNGSTGQPTQALFQADSDICLAFPEDLITMSLKWRMLKAIGNAYEEEFGEYERARDRRTGRETMARALPLNARAGQLRLLNSQQVPDTGFGT